MLTFPRFEIMGVSAPQPLIGSFITAGIGSPVNGIPTTITLGNLSESSGQNDTQIFTPGSWAVLIDPNGANVEEVIVQKIITGAVVNQLVLGPKTSVTPGGIGNPVTENPHVSGVFGVGTWILPKLDYNSILVQPEDGNAANFLFIGNTFNFTATYKRIIKLAKVASGSQPNVWTNTCSSPGNPLISSELWILGATIGDAYTVSLNQV